MTRISAGEERAAVSGFETLTSLVERVDDKRTEKPLQPMTTGTMAMEPEPKQYWMAGAGA